MGWKIANGNWTMLPEVDAHVYLVRGTDKYPDCVWLAKIGYDYIVAKHPVTCAGTPYHEDKVLMQNSYTAMDLVEKYLSAQTPA